MNLKPFLALAATSAFVTACSPGSLNCSDDDVTDTVKEIAFDDDSWKAASNNRTYTYTISDIRLQSSNKETGKISCASNIWTYVKTNSKEWESGPEAIEYTAQLTDEGKIYVEVFGL